MPVNTANFVAAAKKYTQLITCQVKNLGPTNAGPRFLRKSAFGNTIVVTVFTFIAIPTAGFASLGHEFAVLGAIELDFLVLFHFIPPVCRRRSPPSVPVMWSAQHMIPNSNGACLCRRRPRLPFPSALNHTVEYDPPCALESQSASLLPQTAWNSIPWASGSFRDQLMVQVWRRI